MNRTKEISFQPFRRSTYQLLKTSLIYSLNIKVYGYKMIYFLIFFSNWSNYISKILGNEIFLIHHFYSVKSNIIASKVNIENKL
jgi:hypothetical protein